jgi:Mrp family chromosome partitioning ATPase
VRRTLHAARERGTRLLGVIENMAGPQFPGDAGDTLAREFAIPLLARIPFNPGDVVWQALGGRL